MVDLNLTYLLYPTKMGNAGGRETLQTLNEELGELHRKLETISLVQREEVRVLEQQVNACRTDLARVSVPPKPAGGIGNLPGSELRLFGALLRCEANTALVVGPVIGKVDDTSANVREYG